MSNVPMYANSASDLKRTTKFITMSEVVASGLLLSINIDFLHPLGLALMVTFPEDGSGANEPAEFKIVDSREDSAGFIFEPVDLYTPEATQKRIAFLRFQDIQVHRRMAVLGTLFQYVPGPYCLICGCTQEEACFGGCAWFVEPDLETGEPGVCTRCRPVEESDIALASEIDHR